MKSTKRAAVGSTPSRNPPLTGWLRIQAEWRGNYFGCRRRYRTREEYRAARVEQLRVLRRFKNDPFTPPAPGDAFDALPPDDTGTAPEAK